MAVVGSILPPANVRVVMVSKPADGTRGMVVAVRMETFAIFHVGPSFTDKIKVPVFPLGIADVCHRQCPRNAA